MYTCSFSPTKTRTKHEQTHVRLCSFRVIFFKNNLRMFITFRTSPSLVVAWYERPQQRQRYEQQYEPNTASHCRISSCSANLRTNPTRRTASGNIRNRLHTPSFTPCDSLADYQPEHEHCDEPIIQAVPCSDEFHHTRCTLDALGPVGTHCLPLISRSSIITPSTTA